jgi:DNA polymerase-3 subunit alpha
VNKKTIESLAFAGSFDCFPEHHRAQFFYVPDGETINGLERVIRYGQVVSNQNANSMNTLFGDLPAMEIPPPRLPECPHWPLIVQLDREKEVTGMFLSGHPLDHYKFEMKHYGITPIADLNEFREVIQLQPNPGRQFRLIGLVAEVQHKIAKSGNKYGNFIIEDYSGKTTVTLFREDYLRLSPLLQQGTTVLINGYFRSKFNSDEFMFAVQSVSLAESMKRMMTRQVSIEIHPKDLDNGTLDFLEKNVRKHPGKACLKFVLTEPKNRMKVNLVTMNPGFEMNEEMIHFLENRPDLEVQVQTV